MDLMETIRERRSIRKFQPDPVDESDLKEIIQAGILAPNAENDQMWRFVAVTNKKLIMQMSDIVSAKFDAIDQACRALGYDELGKQKYFSVFFGLAPAIIVAFCRPFLTMEDKALSTLNMQLKTPIAMFSVQQSMGAALQNITLAAHAKGFGTTWMTGPLIADQEIADLLEVPNPWVLAALLPIGRPAQNPKPRPRMTIDEVFSLIK